MKRPLHILMTADTVGGVWTYALDLARSLGPLGVRVTLATLGREPSNGQRIEAASIGCLQIVSSAHKLEWMPDPWDDVDRSGDWLLHLERELRPDLVHVNGYAHAALPFLAPKVVVAHSCVVSWWRAVHGHDAPGDWDAYRDRVRAGLRGADAIVAVTGAMASDLRACYGDDWVEPQVIPNGRTLPPPKGATLSGYEGRKWPFVLSAGRLWDQAKNLNALEAVARDLPWPVYVAGDECAPGAGHKAPVAPNVRRLGKLAPDHLLAFLRRAGIYALPARYEPFGLSVLEAALCGCGLILGDIPSLRENWHDAALFVSPDDADSLKRAVSLMAGDEALRRTLADEALRRAQPLSASAMASGYRALYDTLLLG